MLNNLLLINLKLLQKENFKKKAEATDDLICNKILSKIAGTPKIVASKKED